MGEDPNDAANRLTVLQVRSLLDAGNTFFTRGTQSGRTARVLKFDCSCGYKTVKSLPDAVQDNNLDHLRTCNWI